MCICKQFQIPLVKAGVPQGSVPGPLLFLLYINDIADDLLCLTRLFSDDTSLSYSSQSPYTIEDVMNSDLENISIWSKQWLVNFNPQKIKAMVFSNINLPNDVEITFQDKLVEFVTCHKHLGLTFDSKGTFHIHIVNIIKSTSQGLRALRKLKYVLNRHYHARIYLIFIRPMLEYACDLWDGCSQQDSGNLEKLQLEAGRIVTRLSLFASRESIYSETGWELLSDMRRVGRLSLFYSIHNKSAPEYLCD